MKGSIKIKILISILFILILGAITTFCYATEEKNGNVTNSVVPATSDQTNIVPATSDQTNIVPATSDPIIKEPETGETEIKLNRKVKFTGKVYRYYTGSKMFFLNAVKKEYTQTNPGEGIINIILNDKKFGIHIMGEGWIAENQILSSSKFIQLTFESEGDGIKLKLKVSGEYFNIQSDDNAIITFEDGQLKAVKDGQTNVSFTTKEGKEIDVAAIVNDGSITLNIPEKSLSTDMKIDAKVVEKVKINAEATSISSLQIEDEKIEVINGTEGVIDVNDKNIAKITTTAEVEANKTEDGVDVTTKGEQKLSLLQRIAVALNEALTTIINGKGINDPTVDVNGNVLDQNIINVQDYTIPIFSTLRTLLTKLFS